MPLGPGRDGQRRARALSAGLALLVAGLVGGSSPPEPKPAGSERAQHTQPAPRPGALDSEARHVKTYDAAIKPLRTLALSPEDSKRLRDAFGAIGNGDLIGAKSMASGLSHPAARKLVDWYTLFRGYGSAEDYAAFIANNPSWPEISTLRGRLEALLFEKSASAPEAQKAIGTTPQTGAGAAVLASLALARGAPDEAQRLARQAWREHDFGASTEKLFLARFSDKLTLEDHKWRIDRLLGTYIRWRAQRGGRVAAVTRMLALLPAGEQAKVKARIAAFQESSTARALMRKLPEDKTPDWGLAFNRVQMLRRGDGKQEARKILLSAPTDPKLIANPDGWWHERYFSAFDALKAGDAKTAYALTANAGPLSANEANDQSFFAGWLALRHLKQPKLALDHFKALAKRADGPLSRSRAHYWLGRTYEQLGDAENARTAYEAAAKVPDTFDSQLARLKLGRASHDIAISMPAAPSEAEITRFNELDSVQAATIAAKAGLPSVTTRRFLNRLRLHFVSEAELAMLAHLAEAFGDTQTAVRIGKTAIGLGHNLMVYSYPVHAFPAYSPLRTPPETAMLLGIARQESEFNTLTQSGAGARGLMQVMPITARHVCRDYKISCNIPRLMTDKVYNTMLASAYIGDRMQEFDGSYVLTIAGYNAGPGRVRQWVREFGDPRQAGVDPIDWILRIPFEETRLYVQKVLSNVQIYRARLAAEPVRIGLSEDLRRVAARSSQTPQQAATD